jgi:hypothetical protein
MASGPVVLVIADSSELRQELRNVMPDILRLAVAEAGDLRAAVELFARGLRPTLPWWTSTVLLGARSPRGCSEPTWSAGRRYVP